MFNKPNPARFRSLIALPLLLSGVMAEAATGASTDALKERVNQRWAALIERDFEAVYAYQTPAYREVYPLGAFLGKYGSQVDWISAEFKDASLAEPLIVEQDGMRELRVAKVQVQLESRVPFPPEAPMRTTSTVDETWLFVDDQWWFGK